MKKLLTSILLLISISVAFAQNIEFTRLNLDTRHLKSDYYFIHIKIDGEKEIIKKQVIIKN